MAEQPKKPVADEHEFLAAASGKERGIVAEFIGFMGENKVWWMAPILIVLALVGILLILGSTGAAPFLYTLF